MDHLSPHGRGHPHLRHQTQHAPPDKPCRTRDIKLHGAPAIPVPGPFARYGDDAGEIAKLVAGRPGLAEPIGFGFDFIMAEVVYAVRHEMARTVEDVLSRRMRLLLLDAKAASAAAPAVASLMARELNAPDHWEQQQVKAFQYLAATYYISDPA